MVEIVVRISSLCKQFQLEDTLVKALNNIDLKIDAGEFICLYGPSGAGKTTLLNIIGGLDKATCGKVCVFGHDLETYDEDFLATFRATHVGFVFQTYNLISTLTAQENIAFAIELAGWKTEKITQRTKDLLKLVGLENRKNHFPEQLSGGERQRIAFARALANEPPLLLADEPTGNLDTETGLKIFQILEQIKAKGKTVIVATHDEKLLNLASRSLCLKNGRLIQI